MQAFVNACHLEFNFEVTDSAQPPHND
jgi:hypothetical protein